MLVWFTKFYLSFNASLTADVTNVDLGRIMRTMEMNIWLLEALFVLNIEIFHINIWLLVMSKTFWAVTSKSKNVYSKIFWNQLASSKTGNLNNFKTKII